VIAPPSKAAVIFLPDIAGKVGKGEAGSVMAVWLFLSGAKDGFNTTIYKPFQKLMPPTPTQYDAPMNNPG